MPADSTLDSFEWSPIALQIRARARWCRGARPSELATRAQKYFDVISNLTREEFDRDYFDAFNPIVTYAAPDDDGWHAPGKMGWFGCSSDEPMATRAFKRDFMKRFIKAADQPTLSLSSATI